MKGEVLVTKTLQEFKDVDKNLLMAEHFNLGKVDDQPEQLAAFFVLAHAVRFELNVESD